MGKIDEDDFDVEATATEASEAPAAEAPAEESPTTDTEAPATAEGTEGEATEATAEQDEAAKKAAEAKAAAEEYERLFAAFKEAVEAAVRHDEVDPTGHLHEALKVPVAKAYTEMPGAKGKNAAKAYLQEQMQQNMLEGAEDQAKFILARSYLQLFREVPKEAGGKTPGEPKPQVVVDPTDAFVARIAALLIAPNLTMVPEGVSADWREKSQAKVKELREQVQTYRDWLTENSAKAEDERAAAPEVDAIVLAAAKVASGKAAGKAPRAKAAGTTSTSTGAGYSGPRRSITEHIRQAFEGHPVGTWLSVADIAKFQSTEYGDDRPSSGAVSAGLFKRVAPGVFEPKTLDIGVNGEERDHKGGIKVA